MKYIRSCSLLLILCASLSLVACFGDGDKESSRPQTTVTETETETLTQSTESNTSAEDTSTTEEDTVMTTDGETESSETTCTSTDPLAPHTHEYEAQVIAPSCTEGYTLYTCLHCDHSYTDSYTEALGHSYHDVWYNASCADTQSVIHTCTVCGFSYEEDTDTPGTVHTIYQKKVVSPTKTEEGYTLLACKKCSHTQKSNVKPATGHSMGLAYEKIDGTYYVTGMGSCKDTELVIPAVNEHGNRVQGIYYSAFEGQTKLTSLTLPGSGISVLSYAFAGCTGLQTLTVPNGTTLQEGCFKGCTGLTEMTTPLYGSLVRCFAPDDVQGDKPPQSLKTIHITHISSDGNLQGMIYLENVTVAASVTVIPDRFVYGCTALTSVKLPDSIKTVGQSAFEESGLTAFTAPAGITAIPSRAFFGCTDLTSVTLHDGITGIGTQAFEGCIGLYEINLPAKLQHLGGSAFAGTGLQSVTVPTTLTKIAEYTFADCTELSEITLHDGITEFGQYALRGTSLTAFVYPKQTKTSVALLKDCVLLNDVVFNDIITDLGTEAFAGCIALKSVTVPATVTTIGSSAFKGCSALKSVTLHDDITEIGESAFHNCAVLSEIALPSRLTRIENNTFFQCASLNKVNIPATVKHIGYGAFFRCGLLYGVELPVGLQKIDTNAFRGSGLLEVTVPGATVIGQEAFAECAYLERVTLSGNVTLDYQRHFIDCPNLEEVTLEEGFTAISPNAFQNCISLTKLQLPDSLTAIKAHAFDGCAALPEVTLPKSLVTLDSEAFLGCTALKKLTLLTNDLSYVPTAFTALEALVLGDNITRIPGGLCRESKLTEIVIPAGVTEIGKEAFASCTNLQRVVLPEGLTAIKNTAFALCTSLQEVNFPSTLILVDDSAFSHTALEKITVTGPDLTFGKYVFASCTRLKEVDFGDGRVYCMAGAFQECTALQALTGTSLVSVKDGSVFPERFYKTENGLTTCCATLVSVDMRTITTDVILPDHIAFIADQAFYKCSIVRTLQLPDGLLEIGYAAFSGCASLMDVQLPATLEKLEESAFSDCTSLTSVRVPDSVTYMGKCVFFCCTALTEVIFPDGLEHIPAYTLAYCPALESITVGSGLRSIDTDFYLPQLIRSFYTINYNGTQEQWAQVSYGTNSYIDSCSIVCTDGTIFRPLATGYIGSTQFHYVLTSDLTLTVSGNGSWPVGNIPYDIRCTKKLVISEGITSFSLFGTTTLPLLEEVDFPSTLQSFDINSMKNTPWYQTAVAEKNGLLIVNDRLIYVSPELSGALTLPEGITVIGGGAFDGCHGLTEVIISEGVTKIDGDTFVNCAALTAIVIPASVTLPLAIPAQAKLFLVSESNASLFTGTYYLYAETKPADGGLYWHYDESGTPIVYD